MFTFHFTKFIDTLDIQEPIHNGIPKDSPVIIIYQEKGDLSKHEILRRFKKILFKYDITYLRPLKNITSEWVINLKEFRHSFECLKESDYLKGQLTLEPEYFHSENRDVFTEELINETTSIKFSIYPEDLNIFSITNSISIPKELNNSLNRFKKDFNQSSKCGFLMMKFEDTPIQKKLVQVIKDHFKNQNVFIMRADEKWYDDDLLNNIKTYMHGCQFGIALFDRIKSNYFNPNVSLEIGYMTALNKPVLLLKDSTLDSLQTDLVGKLYHEFDFQNPEETLPIVLNKWINDKEILN